MTLFGARDSSAKSGAREWRQRRPGVNGTHPAVRAVVAVGSIATGVARPDSDIDAFVFMDPLDLYLVPAESIWRPADDTFHSIMVDDESLDRDSIQLDFHRVTSPSGVTPSTGGRNRRAASWRPDGSPSTGTARSPA